jgi:hypothetical protein
MFVTGYRIYFGTEVIHIVQANIRMTNGVMHLIDGVLFTNSPTADEVIASRATVLREYSIFTSWSILCVITMYF